MSIEGSFKSRIEPIVNDMMETMEDDLKNEINSRLKELNKEYLNRLSEGYKKEKAKEKRFKRIKNNIQIGTVVLGGFLAVAALVTTIFTIVFSQEILAGTLFLTVYSVTLTIAPAFNSLYTAIKGYFDYINEKKQNKKGEIDQLKERISDISTQIKDRIKCIKHIPENDRQVSCGEEILKQIREINAFIQSVKKIFPNESMTFQKFDPSLLLTTNT